MLKGVKIIIKKFDKIMPRLYLFRITHLQTKIGRRVAVLIKGEKEVELSNIQQGKLTNYFDKNKAPSDFVDYKGSIEVGDDVYNKVIEKLEKSGSNPAITVTNLGGKFHLVVNKEEILLAQFPTKSRNFIEYPFVFIKN